jgi:8-oxo-dGTP pyrophosphatase MutT (NUDIX family)
VIEILLVTSRATRRWIIPKGWPIKGLTPRLAAAREAYEEAGVRGRVGGRALGSYVYDKRLDNGGGVVPCEVRVFPLAVKRQLKAWPEAGERTTRWFSAAEAVDLVADEGLRALIREIGTQDPGTRRKD